MARSSNSDPIEKFRFQVTIFENIRGLLTNGTSNIATTPSRNIMSRAGFSEVGTPRVKTKEIEYRENTHGNTLSKQPGLSRYEPIPLRRGMTKDSGMYRWYQAVNNEASTLSKFQAALSDTSNIPSQDPDFRREVLISVMDREGKFGKHWMLYNAWPIEYKGSSDLDAKASELAVEEIILTFENSMEVKGATIKEALHNISIEAENAAEKSGIMGAISGTLGFLRGF